MIMPRAACRGAGYMTVLPVGPIAWNRYSARRATTERSNEESTRGLAGRLRQRTADDHDALGKGALDAG